MKTTPCNTKPPTVLDGFIQPHFPFARVFTCLFLPDTMVFAKTGSIGANAGGIMRGTHVGYTLEAMVTGAIGTLVDVFTHQSRGANAVEIVAFSAENMVATYKRNFMLSYDDVENVEIKGPNFAGELRIVIYSTDTRHKFRIDRQSKESAKYVRRVFEVFLPRKIQES